MKLVVFLMGLIAGSAGAVSWLLSSNTSSEAAAPVAAAVPVAGAVPVPPPPGMATTLVDDLRRRLEVLEIRFREARAAGERAGNETEERLRRELEAYRKNPSHPEKS